MGAIPADRRPSRPLVDLRLSTGVAVLAVVALGVGLGLHVAVTVNGARSDDGSMLRLLPWFLYPGAVAIIAVRTRAEMLVSGLSAVVPIATFAATYDKLNEMGIGVPLSYAAVLIVGTSVASYVARRTGPVWALGSLVVGALATIGFVFICVSLLVMWPTNYAGSR